jgi:hypothetical protein
MNFKANSQFRAAAFSAFESWLVPKLTRAADKAGSIVFNKSQDRVPVDTEELKLSGHYDVEWKGQSVTSTVAYDSGHAAYVEFGTGIRGAGSPGAGPYPYDLTWPGMVAQPYLRNSLDESLEEIKGVLKDEGFAG